MPERAVKIQPMADQPAVTSQDLVINAEQRQCKQPNSWLTCGRRPTGSHEAQIGKTGPCTSQREDDDGYAVEVIASIRDADELHHWTDRETQPPRVVGLIAQPEM